MSINYSLLALLTGEDDYFQGAKTLNQAIKLEDSARHSYFLSSLAWSVGIMEKGATIKCDFSLLKEEMKNILLTQLPPYALIVQASRKKDIEICFNRRCLPPINDVQALEIALKSLLIP
jgi:hypothetical protein